MKLNHFNEIIFDINKFRNFYIYGAKLNDTIDLLNENTYYVKIYMR